MQFVIQFKADNRDSAIILKEERLVGLDFLDQVRTELSNPTLDMALVGDTVPYLKVITYDKIVDEVKARTLDVFENTDKFVVTMPFRFLNQFVTLSYNVTKDINDVVTAITPKYTIDWDVVVDAWVTAGTPSNWAS